MLGIEIKTGRLFEFEEACKIEPKKDYTIWFFALFFVAILVLVSNK